jgi:putative ABC transport system permease protein
VNRHFARFVSKVRALFTPGAADAAFEREVAAHLAFLKDQFLRQGLPPAEAGRQAQLAIGGLEHTRQSHRDARALLWLSQARQDIRQALRSMRREPGFAAASILTLALGVGANTAVFSVIDAVLLRSLPYPEPDRIVQLFLASADGSTAGTSISDLRFLLERATSIEDIAAFDFGQSEMGLTSGFPEQVHGIHVTSGYFAVFSTPILLGRAFSPSDDQGPGSNIVILSYELWRTRFGGDLKIVGKQISLDKQPFTVIGVTGSGFRSEPAGTRLWIPFHFDRQPDDKVHSFGVVARLKPGISLAQANAQLDAASRNAQRTAQLPESHFQFQLRNFRDAMVGRVRPSLLVLQGTVILVLLIACANLASLFLVRMTTRRQEFAIRAAIGAGHGRILRQLITESLLLCSLGCAAGVALGLLAIRAMLHAAPGNLPRIGQTGSAFGLDGHVLAFAVLLCLATGLLFGSLPALAAFRTRITGALNPSGSQQSMGVRVRRSQSIVVVGEVALSLILLIGAVLLLHTFFDLIRVDPGFDPQRVLVMTMPLRVGHADPGAQVENLIRDTHLQLAAVPGVEFSAATFSPPFASRMGLPFASESGQAISGDGEWQAVSPDYFSVLRIPLLRGRTFNAGDNAGAVPVVLINDAMARRFWPKQNPLGQLILIGKGISAAFEDKPRRIVGVVADTRDDDLSSPPGPTMIIPTAQVPDGIVEFESQFGPLTWLIRTRVEPHRALASAIAEQLQKASLGRPVGSQRTMQDVLSQSIESQRFNMLLVSIFALIALLLASIGIYGVVDYAVARRTQEIGIRLALGADREAIRRLILRESSLQGMLGVLSGAVGALFLVRFLDGLLYGVSIRDPATFAAGAVLLELLTVLSAWIPAQKATRLDPIKALRCQ